jgi:hypothetical protein
MLYQVLPKIKLISKKKVIDLKKKAQKKEVYVDSTPTTEELVAEDHFLLHTLLDVLMEKELILKAELQDKLDNIESELFVEECEEKKQGKKKPKKK